MWCRLYGDKGDTGERKLDKSNTHMDKFERGQTDNFDIKAVDLGKLSKVKVWHDNSGLSPAWYLDKVVVTNTSDNATFEFPCERWLAKVCCTSRRVIDADMRRQNQDDHNIVRELSLRSELPIQGMISSAAATTYHLYVTTSNINHASTDANVFVQCVACLPAVPR